MSDRILVFEIYQGDELVRVERIEREIVKIGSLPTSHLRLDDPGVSSIHAVVEVSGADAVQCIDLGSANGTRVNGNRINKTQLNEGDVLEFGETRVVFRTERPKPKAAPSAGAAGAGRPGPPGLPGAAAGPARSYRYVQLTHRPSDAKHYARRFLSQPSRTDGTVEVAHLWRDHVMVELAMKDKDQTITVGADPKADIIIEHPAIPSQRYPLVTRTPDGSAYLHLSPKMDGEVYIDATRYTIEEAIRKGTGEGLKITAKTRARLNFGESSIFVHQGTRPQIALPFGVIETHLLVFVIISALLHGILMGLVYLVPEDARALDIDRFDLNDSIATIESFEEEPEPTELPEILQQDGEDEEEELAAREQGDEGRAGVEDEEREDRRMAVAGDPDNRQVTLDRREAQELAQERGALSVFRETPGPQSLFGDVASGYDDVTAAGALQGPTIGLARGSGGLGNIGGGWSGGGNNPGGFGVGPIATRGLYGRDREDLGRELSRGLRERGARDIEVELGQPTIEGHLDREIIQRVIREHRREIRDCYQRELQRNPDLSGRIMVSFTIDPRGNVARATVSESDLNSSTVEDCVAARFRRFVFPEPSTPGLVHVNYPFVFTGG
jgi:hypothetical protein